MIVLPISDFDVVLGMDWLNRYRVVIDCHDMILSFKIKGAEVEYKLEKPRLLSMNTKELWEKPMIATLLVDGKEITMEMVPVVRQFSDVFPIELPGLPPEREIEFGIDLLPGVGAISKAPYRMAPMELAELKFQLEELLGKGFIRASISP